MSVTVIKAKEIVVSPEKTLTPGTMIVENGKVKEIGTDISYPIGAEIVDAGDYVIYPGFIDASSHLGINKEPFDYMEDTWDGCDAGAAMQPQLTVTDGFNPFSPALERAREVGVTTAYAAAGHGVIMDGQGIAFKLRKSETADEMFLKDTQQLHFCIGDYPLMAFKQKGQPPMTRMALMDMLRSELRRVKGVVESGEEAGDTKTAVLAKALKREIKVRVYVLAAQDIPLAVKLCEEFGLDYILDGLYEAWKLPEFWEANPQMVLLNGVPFGPMQNSMAAKYEMSKECFSVLEKAGCDIVLTADGVTTTRMLPYMAGFALGHGLSLQHALASITTFPAKLLGLSEHIGTLEAGKDADFSIYTANALLSTSKCMATYVDGMQVYCDKEFGGKKYE
ncbi:MAG: amidohydrolase family protein [Emergencia sp.]|nr:amidohydrolase family protein [Emergencia sp.]